MPCQGVAVMRRKADGWLNATQVLKVAGFDKPQRTRVLEREVQKGTHEKVQGGYGKYQGESSDGERGRQFRRRGVNAWWWWPRGSQTWVGQSKRLDGAMMMLGGEYEQLGTWVGDLGCRPVASRWTRLQLPPRVLRRARTLDCINGYHNDLTTTCTGGARC